MAAPENPAARHTQLSKNSEPGHRVTLGRPDVSFAPLSSLSLHRATDLARLPQILAGRKGSRSTEAFLADPLTWGVEPGEIFADGNRYLFDGLQTPSGLRRVIQDYSAGEFAGAISLDQRPSVKAQQLETIRRKRPLGSRLTQEYARMKPELDTRRSYYFVDVDGDRRLDLDNSDFATVTQYATEILNDNREHPEGGTFGLRVRASERNKDNPEMLAMGKMSLPELVAYIKKPENRRLHFDEDPHAYQLPYDYPKSTTSDVQWGQALFYHDAPVHIAGILASDISDKIDYAKGTVGNLIYELYITRLIGNGSSTQLDTRSNPPSLTRMGWQVYNAMIEANHDRTEALDWLKTVMEAAEYEFLNYWKNQTKYNHFVEGSQLITPGGKDVLEPETAERETGRDMSPEYHGRAQDFMEVNINGQLVGYAYDLARYYRMIGNEQKAKSWHGIGDAMLDEMGEKMFDGTMYRHCDARTLIGQLSEVDNLTSYMPMALGIFPKEHVAAMVKKLPGHRGPFGYAHINPDSVPPRPTEEMLAQFSPQERAYILRNYRDRQWGDGNKNNPEWPIETYQLILGLTRYGYFEQAVDAAEDWILASTEFFNTHGTLTETRDVITGERGVGVEYKQHENFGWSVETFLLLQKMLPHLYNLRKYSRSKQAIQIASKIYLGEYPTDEDKTLAGNLIQFADGSNIDLSVLHAGRAWAEAHDVADDIPIVDLLGVASEIPDSASKIYDDAIAVLPRDVVIVDLVGSR